MTLYQCTYRNCGETHTTVDSIEDHVRREHLLKEDPDRLLQEGEEEFYYNEIEEQAVAFEDSTSTFSSTTSSNSSSSSSKMLLPQQLLLQQQQFHQHYFPIRARSYSSSSASSQLASLSLVDHLDMARPAHEDPGRGAVAQRSILVQKTNQSSNGAGQQSQLITMRSPRGDTAAISMPITIAPSAVRTLFLLPSNLTRQIVRGNNF